MMTNKTLSGSSLQLLAPAKINLSLKVKGRREDGFHEIETHMVPLELGDEITLQVDDSHLGNQEKKSRSISLECTDPTLPADHNNLAYRAADVFLSQTGHAVNLKISLHKRVPHGA